MSKDSKNVISIDKAYTKPKEKVLDPEKLTAVAGELGSKKVDDLFAAVGYGKLAPGNVLAKLVPQEKLVVASAETGLRSVVRRMLRPGQDKIKVQGFDDVMVFRARCCNPIRGEKIIGYITRGKGVSVHVATCSNVLNLFYDPDRRIAVVWDKAPKGDRNSSFTVCLTIQVEDRRGILADVTSTIADIKINVRKVEASSSGDNHGRISITFDITDLKHLERVTKAVTAVPGVLDVERVLRDVS